MIHIRMVAIPSRYMPSRLRRLGMYRMVLPSYLVNDPYVFRCNCKYEVYPPKFGCVHTTDKCQSGKVPMVTKSRDVIDALSA